MDYMSVTSQPWAVLGKPDVLKSARVCAHIGRTCNAHWRTNKRRIPFQEHVACTPSLRRNVRCARAGAWPAVRPPTHLCTATARLMCVCVCGYAHVLLLASAVWRMWPRTGSAAT